MRAQSSLLRELATAVAQLTARDRVVDGEGAHGSGSGQRFAGQPTGSGGAAQRPDLLELAQSGRVGAKSVSAVDDYLAVPELLQRAESRYEAVRPVSRVPGLFPLSTDLTNEYLKQDDRRLPAQAGGVSMDVFFGAHMAALFVALDELLPYVPAANQDFTPYLARSRNHAEAIDKAFRFRLAFLRRLNEIKRVHGDQGVLDVLRAQHFQPASEHLGSAIFGDLMKDYERRVFEATVASSAKATATAREAFGSDELGQRTLDLLSSSLSAQTLKSYAGRLSQFAEFCHDSENISPLEATTATVVRQLGMRLRDPLVWIDLEMTGLDPVQHSIIEIACLVSDGSLDTVVEGPEIAIHTPEATLQGMNEWCQKHHHESGLVDRCRKSKVSLQDAEQAVLEFVRSHVPSSGQALLAGSSVHVDLAFLRAHMPRLAEHLHYRIVDVSTVMELAKRWFPQEFKRAPRKKSSHTAMSDIRDSLAQLKYYRRAVFLTVGGAGGGQQEGRPDGRQDGGGKKGSGGKGSARRR
eukprot:jgi/Tetstr1/438046/TSEL_026672.t1